MAPKRGVGCGRARRGRGGRIPRSCRGGRHGTAPVPSSSPLEEGFWRYDFLLRVRGQVANRVLLPSAFSAIVSERGLDGLFLHLQGSCRSPSYVDLEVDSSRLIFLGGCSCEVGVFSAVISNAEESSLSADVTRAGTPLNRTGRSRETTIP